MNYNLRSVFILKFTLIAVGWMDYITKKIMDLWHGYECILASATYTVMLYYSENI